MKFKGHELTREELLRAMECETAEEQKEGEAHTQERL